MIEKDLRKLNRLELLELMLNQGKEIDSLKKQLQQAEEELAMMNHKMVKLKKELDVAKGQLVSQENQVKQNTDLLLDEQVMQIQQSLVQMESVFQSAQIAAGQYLEQAFQMEERQAQMCERREKESIESARRMWEETVLQCEEMKQKTQAWCEWKEEDTRKKCRQAFLYTQNKIEQKNNKSSR